MTHVAIHVHDPCRVDLLLLDPFLCLGLGLVASDVYVENGGLLL